MRIERAKKNFVAQNGHPPIHAPAARPDIRRQRALILPDRPARSGVERKSAIVLPGAIKNSIHNQRCGFEFPARHRLINPLGNEHRRIRSVDLLQRAEPPPGVVAGVHQPVLRLFRRIQQPLRRHLRASRWRSASSDSQQDECRAYSCNHSERSEESLFVCPVHRFAFHCAPTASKYAITSSRSLSLNVFWS